jgi:hypothetical protein
MTLDSSRRLKRILYKNRLIYGFVFIHLLFAVFLGRFYAFAPDEAGYLATFRELYASNNETNPQSYSGWIAAPTIFLWISYLPAKLLNLVGVPDLLSIRILSIALSALTLYLLFELQNRGKLGAKVSQKFVFSVFFIPSIFLWNSLGLRESFIFAEIALFLFGLSLVIEGSKKRGYVCLFFGSYGLLSTKSYLWAILMLALIFSCSVFLFLKVERRKILGLLAIGFLIPTLTFASTTSVYALNYLFQSDVSETGKRSGNSISQVYVDVPGSGTTGTTPTRQLITFHGDSTLISLHFYLLNNPNTPLSKVIREFGLDKRIQILWDEKIRSELMIKKGETLRDSLALNGHILKPGKITEPLSLIWPAFKFLCGPFPFTGNPGIAISISSLESPLWWALYMTVILQFFRLRKARPLGDPQILFALIFLAGEIFASALVEVNLGTSFRHRSILLIPLVFLYVRLAQMVRARKELI